MSRVIVALLALAIGASAAHAQPKRASKKAEALFEEGTRLYKAGDYDEAVEKFRAGFELSKDPIFVFNIAVALRKKGDCAGALASYEQYLQLSPKATDRARVEERIAEMKACVEKQKPAEPATQEPAATQAPPAAAPVEATPATPLATEASAPPASGGGG
ncbi:MAG TPA: tetratricopeptide repeat protein, partial [Kofleriaceae bacterium]|nr:tetratricopeptide repeat protein [Kofleriaceae bacterium]